MENVNKYEKKILFSLQTCHKYRGDISGEEFFILSRPQYSDTIR